MDPAAAGEAADDEIKDVLKEIIVAGKGVGSTRRVLEMMIMSHLKELPLWELAHEVYLASRFLPNPATEGADTERMVEFLQDSNVMADDFDLEYGHLIELLHKTLGIEGCLSRLRLLEIREAQCHSFDELEALVEVVQLPTKVTRQLLSAQLKLMELNCPEEELDELLIVAGSVSEVVVHLEELMALNKVPKSGDLLSEALEKLFNSQRNKRPEAATKIQALVRGRQTRKEQKTKKEERDAQKEKGKDEEKEKDKEKGAEVAPIPATAAPTPELTRRVSASNAYTGEGAGAGGPLKILDTGKA
jgi:hypothetical protein